MISILSKFSVVETSTTEWRPGVDNSTALPATMEANLKQRQKIRHVFTLKWRSVQKSEAPNPSCGKDTMNGYLWEGIWCLPRVDCPPCKGGLWPSFIDIDFTQHTTKSTSNSV